MKEDKFSWIETHKQLVQYLSTKQNSQKELIQILKSSFNPAITSSLDSGLDAFVATGV